MTPDPRNAAGATAPGVFDMEVPEPVAVTAVAETPLQEMLDASGRVTA